MISFSSGLVNRFKNDHYLDRFFRSNTDILHYYEPQEIEIVLGQGCDGERDIDLVRSEADNVPLYRRRGGGGTVVLSPRMVVIVLVTTVNSLFNNLHYFDTINRAYIDALEKLHVFPVEQKGISDLAINDKKILGGSIYRKEHILFYQGSLMINNDLNLISRYLRMPRSMPEYRRNRNHADFCTNLQQAGFQVDTCSLIESFRFSIGDSLFYLD